MVDLRRSPSGTLPIIGPTPAGWTKRVTHGTGSDLDLTDCKNPATMARRRQLVPLEGARLIDESHGRGTMKNVRTTRSIPHAEYFPSAEVTAGPARWLAVVRNDIREMTFYWPVLQNMVAQDLRVRYQRSFLGFLWTLVNPILMMATLTMVFSQVFHDPNWKIFAIYLFAGQTPWIMFGTAVNECALSIVGNEGLIRKIYLPKLIFPLARVLINLTTFAFSLVALYILAYFFGASFSASMILLPVVTVLFATFALGLGLILAVANTFYRDIGHLIGVLLQAWYFATPIIWGRTDMSAALQARCWLNPAYPFIRMYQLIIYAGEWPTSHLFTAATLLATVSLGIGYVTFKLHENKLVFRL